MSYYHYVKGFKAGFDGVLWIKIIFALFGLLIGSSIGLYVAVKTLPLPETKIYYIRSN